VFKEGGGLGGRLVQELNRTELLGRGDVWWSEAIVGTDRSRVLGISA
jgi:hypothetical protein